LPHQLSPLPPSTHLCLPSAHADYTTPHQLVIFPSDSFGDIVETGSGTCKSPLLLRLPLFKPAPFPLISIFPPESSQPPTHDLDVALSCYGYAGYNYTSSSDLAREKAENHWPRNSPRRCSCYYQRKYPVSEHIKRSRGRQRSTLSFAPHAGRWAAPSSRLGISGLPPLA
jgi:hypothetical protein